jgi:tyrosinase
MGQVETAGQDPIFFLHHANIDRLWNAWLAQGGGREDPLSDATWKGNSFLFFDENGNQVRLTPCDVLRCSQQLNYTYENEPPQVYQSCFKFILPWKYLYYYVIHFPPIPPVELNQKVTIVELDIRKVRDKLASLAESKNDTLVLKLENVVAAKPPGVVWQVFLGAPRGSKLSTEGEPERQASAHRRAVGPADQGQAVGAEGAVAGQDREGQHRRREPDAAQVDT